jgi:hypothetical protein
MTGLRGKWAQGLQPRNFTWIIKDRLAAAERPGGLSRNHRKVRRHEELIWLRSNGFTRIVSLLDSPHNLAAYSEAGLVPEHLPFGKHDELPMRLEHHYTRVGRWLDDPREKLFVHYDEFGEKLLGFLGGYLLFSGLVQEGPHAIAIVEKLGNRTLGAAGRELVAITLDHELKRR